MGSTYFTADKHFCTILLVILFRYVFLASLGFLLYYVIFRKKVFYKKIQTKLPANRDYYREIGYSLITAVVFALIGYGVFGTPFVKYTQTYWKIGDYGTGYFVVSIFLMILFHDAYFYWTHRWMHGKGVYKIVHRVHHLSTNPSPWAAMAFHPIESVIEGGVIAFIAILFPVHPLAIAIFLLFMMVYNVYGHLGYELYPKGFSKSIMGKWINTSVNHNLHHQTFQGNYGLYFLWWDRWMGTLHAQYDEHFEEVGGRVRSQNSVASSQ